MPQQRVAQAERAAAAADEGANAAGARAGAAAGVVAGAVVEARQLADQAQAEAHLARQAFNAGQPQNAETHAQNAIAAAENARPSIALALMGLGACDIKDEWEECCRTIDRFDKLLVDLRKTGFS